MDVSSLCGILPIQHYVCLSIFSRPVPFSSPSYSRGNLVQIRQGQDVCAIFSGWGAARERSEGVGRAEEEGGAEVMVGVEVHFLWKMSYGKFGYGAICDDIHLK